MLIVANWKAYIEDLKKGKELVTAAKRLVRAQKCDIVLAPPAPFLGALAAGNTSKIVFATQDVSATLGGAATGENTAAMCASAGAQYAIIGHSERRAAGDSNEIVAAKLSHAIARNLSPILCIGEAQRDSEGRYLAGVREQIVSALTPLTQKERGHVSIAYEPLWAIGKSADNAIRPHDLAEMVLYIRKVLSELLSGKDARAARVIYGGAVEPSNIRDLARESGVDGFLVGHASADEHSFTELIRQVS